jgi:hypothetical protein
METMHLILIFGKGKNKAFILTSAVKGFVFGHLW